MYTIYLITNLTNGKVYVGQTKRRRKRWYDHQYSATHGKQKPLYASMRKYGLVNFEFWAIETVNTKPEADAAEMFWVEAYGSTRREFGYNLAKGGGGSNGYKHGPAYCLQLGNRRRGSVASPETREKIRQAAAKHRHGEQAKAKLSALKGEIANHFDASISTADVVKLRSAGLSFQRIANTLGTTAALVKGRVHRAGLPLRLNKTDTRRTELRSAGKEHLINPDNAVLAALYLNQNMTCKEIGALYEMSEKGISWRLRKYGVKMRPKFGNKPTVLAVADSQLAEAY